LSAQPDDRPEPDPHEPDAVDFDHEQDETVLYELEREPMPDA